MKPEPGAGRAQDIRERSQVRARLQEGALAGLWVDGTLCGGHAAFPSLFLASTLAGGLQGEPANPTSSTKSLRLWGDSQRGGEGTHLQLCLHWLSFLQLPFCNVSQSNVMVKNK